MADAAPAKKTRKKKEPDWQLAARMIRAGFADKDVYTALGISKITWWSWRKRNPKIEEVLKGLKAEADVAVERSLYERACGYSHPEDKIFLGPGGTPVIVPTRKHYPPDTVAMIFWLKNRQPDKWRDRVEQAITVGTEEKRLMQHIGEILEASRAGNRKKTV